MASEDDDRVIPVTLPADVDEWIESEATRRGLSQEAVCRQLLTAVHSVSTDDGHAVSAEDGKPVSADDYQDELAELGEKLDAQREELDTHREELDSHSEDLETYRETLENRHEEFVGLIEDVRARVIQVKREADAKAPADHEHEAYASADELERLAADLEALEETTRGGFDNFEEILEYLLERSETLSDRSTVLGKAILDLRETRTELRERQRRRAEADRLQLAANRSGVRTAACDACGSSVDLGLLTEPECPHCGQSISDVEEKDWIFGSHVLVTGDPPALEGRIEGASTSEGADVFDAVAAETTGAESDRPDLNPTSGGDGE